MSEREQLEYEIGLVRKRVALSNCDKPETDSSRQSKAQTPSDEALQAEAAKLRAKVQGLLAERQANLSHESNTKKKEEALTQRLERMRKESAQS